MALKRNDPCWCGTGRKYEYCHQKIDAAFGAEKYAASQAVYAQNWETTAEMHSNAGVYEWLAGELKQFQPRRILDVGSGSGHGLISFLKVLGDDTSIVAIDENPNCLQLTRSTLEKIGLVEIELEKRVTVTTSSRGFSHTTKPIGSSFSKQVTLLESDLCDDPYLADALLKSGPFDAVTVWMSGVHMLRQHNESVLASGVKSDGEHRLYVQNAAYELADKILKVGGVLQIGERGVAMDYEFIREDLLRSHREQASVTSLKVLGLTHRPYQEPESGRTPMVLTPGTSGMLPPDRNTSIISILSRKP